MLAQTTGHKHFCIARKNLTAVSTSPLPPTRPQHYEPVELLKVPGLQRVQAEAPAAEQSQQLEEASHVRAARQI